MLSIRRKDAVKRKILKAGVQIQEVWIVNYLLIFLSKTWSLKYVKWFSTHSDFYCQRRKNPQIWKKKKVASDSSTPSAILTPSSDLKVSGLFYWNIAQEENPCPSHVKMWKWRSIKKWNFSLKFFTFLPQILPVAVRWALIPLIKMYRPVDTKKIFPFWFCINVFSSYSICYYYLISKN